jgi:hypothetical protein
VELPGVEYSVPRVCLPQRQQSPPPPHPPCLSRPLGLEVRVPTNDVLFDRLETVRCVRLFTRERDMEYTGCGNTEHRGLKARVLP